MNNNLDVEKSLKIVTYNVYLSVCPPLRFNGAFSRANHIAASLYNHMNNNNHSKAKIINDSQQTPAEQLDIICLQELVVQREKVLSGFYHHPFRTKKVTTSFFSDNIRFIHSGLAIVSKWPILEEDGYIFRGDAYHMEAFMAKGVQYAKIFLKRKFIIHVFNTHTQAWINDRAHAIRKNQFEQIAQFIQSKKIPHNEAVFLTGDFNLDVFEQQVHVNEIFDIVQMTLFKPSEPQFSFDPSVNVLVGTDDANEYATQSFQNGCYDEYLQTGVCSCCPKQLIDGVATSNKHLPVQLDSFQVLQNKSTEAFDMFISVSTMKKVSFVSDHFPVLVECSSEDFILFIDADNDFKCAESDDVYTWFKNFSLPWFCLECFLFIVLYIVFLILSLFIRKYFFSQK